MSSVLSSIINLVNTAFGVTVLAVPYCFHQCGIILGGILLFLSSYTSKRSCCLLLRSAQISRRRDFESLGFHVDGVLGKFVVEMSLIGYLVGTAIAWFVVIGDVAPAVLSSLLGTEKSWSVRLLLIASIGIGAVLPLSLVKDITSLSSASNLAISIYCLFVLQLFLGALPKMITGEWIDAVNFWRPEGVLHCLPIFGISFLCQTALFVLYDALPEPSVKKMEHVVSTAMDIVFVLSATVGFCGYVMYFNDGIQGDLLNNYEHDFISEFIRLGFCISTILSFPLLVFPCRVSINSMVSSAKMQSVENIGGGETFIPHERFFTITVCLVIGTLIFGILFPNVEFVMALVGATMGVMLTYILPSYIYLRVAGDDTSKTEAKVLLVLGISLFCLSTFSVLSMSESREVTLKPVTYAVHRPIINDNGLPKTTKKVTSNDQLTNLNISELVNAKKENTGDDLGVGKQKVEAVQKLQKRDVEKFVEHPRKEPVMPQERVLMGQAEEKRIRVPETEPLKNNDNVGVMERKVLSSVEDIHTVNKSSMELDVKIGNINDVHIKPSVSTTNVSSTSNFNEMQPVDDGSEKQLGRTENGTAVGVPDESGKKLHGVPGGVGDASADKSVEKLPENKGESQISQDSKSEQFLKKYLFARSKLRTRTIKSSESVHREV